MLGHQQKLQLVNTELSVIPRCFFFVYVKELAGISRGLSFDALIATLSIQLVYLYYHNSSALFDACV